MSIFRSRSEAQPSETVQRLQAEAREDYAKHNSPETQAAAREARAWAQINGNAAARSWRGSKR